MGAGLVEFGGFLPSASCSHTHSLERFSDHRRVGIARGGCKAALIRSAGGRPGHIRVDPMLPESSYLEGFGLCRDLNAVRFRSASPIRLPARAEVRKNRAASSAEP